MYILVSYDINTVSPTGKTRLRKVAKICLNYGQRVQNSVFECKVDEVEYLTLKYELSKIIDKNTDNLLFYRLGKNYKKNIEFVGVNKVLDIDGPLIL